jgi:hypothetical protein
VDGVVKVPLAVAVSVPELIGVLRLAKVVQPMPEQVPAVTGVAGPYRAQDRRAEVGAPLPVLRPEPCSVIESFARLSPLVVLYEGSAVVVSVVL